MREIKKNDRVLARHITSDDLSDGLNFFSKDEEFIQVGAWSYNSGKEINAHLHNKFPRTADRTCEVLYVISGVLEAKIFDLDKQLLETLTVQSGEALILLECGHSYTILSDNTKVLEVKNGPYFGPETDRQRF